MLVSNGCCEPNRYAPHVIVVIGHPLAVVGADGARPAGAAVEAAMAATEQGAEVQLVGKLGDDDVGDAVVLALGSSGIGHAALLRDPSRATPLLVRGVETEDLDTGDDELVDLIEPAHAGARPTLEAADVELGLRYLSDFRAVVLADPQPAAVVAVAAEAARYAGAVLLGVASAGGGPAPELPPGSFFLAAASGGGDGAAKLLGRVAAGIDRGDTPEEVLNRELAAVGATAPRG